MRSMTGCGRGSAVRDTLTVTAEVRTVNHRFLDLSCRLPRPLSFLEDTVRKRCAAYLRRGHAEIYLAVQDTGASRTQLQVDLPLADAYAKAARELAEITGVPDGLTAFRLLQLEGVATPQEAPLQEELIREAAEEALDKALTETVAMREREGEALCADLLAHLDAASALRDQIEVRAPKVVEAYRTRLTARLEELLGAAQVDQARLAEEVALMADRCAIDEELARLISHIGQLRSLVQQEGELGKKLDFLVQEMNREANTIGSKANDAAIAQLVVNLKSEIEKLREQIQNVE